MATSLYIDGRYESLHPTWHAEDSEWKGRQVIAMLRRNHLEPRTVCEVGCGAGGILRMLQRNLPSECILHFLPGFSAIPAGPESHGMITCRGPKGNF